MKVVDGEIISELVIKKSRFICFLKYVDHIEEAKKIIAEVKKIHKDANHNCSCYLIGSKQKADDDGEPQKTAGIPMLEVLKHNEIDNIVCVVTRYFGGIKLGHGGLIRAYSKSVSNSLSVKPLFMVSRGVEFELIFLINHVSLIDYTLRQEKIKVVSKEFSSKVKYKLTVLEDEFDKICALIEKKIQLVEVKNIKHVNYFRETNE